MIGSRLVDVQFSNLARIRTGLLVAALDRLSEKGDRGKEFTS